MSQTGTPPPIQCFAPLAAPDARVLILGSMPGQASLDAGQYYAHPRNAFWPIMSTLLGIAPSAGYSTRVQALLAARIALWDVLHSCRRQGSADAGIARDSEQANDFSHFFAQCPRIREVFFNGQTAAAAFRRHVQGKMALPPLHYHTLPSTSPANAQLRRAQKLAAWQVVVASLQAG